MIFFADMRCRVRGWGNVLHYPAIALLVCWCSCWPTQLRKSRSRWFILYH